MNFTFTKSEPVVKKNCFEIHIKYEHGDADYSEVQDFILNTVSTDDLERYLAKFKEIVKVVDDRRFYGVEVPDWMKDKDAIDVEGTNLHINLNQDNYSSGNHLFAGMAIVKILFFDVDGEEFIVSYN